MELQLPVRVGLMDDDFFALKWNADLLTRDLRTTVRLEAESPQGLLRGLRGGAEIDVLLLDVEYLPEVPPLPELIHAASRLQAGARILCLSQYGDPQALQASITGGASGFLLKRDVRMGIGSAVVLARKVDFLITPGVFPILQQNHRQIWDSAARINAWVPHPGLSPQLLQVFTLRVLYGMSAPLAAQEIHLAPGTVEKYMQYIYQKLSLRWGDEAFLVGLSLDDLPPEVQAFHQYTLPPRG